MNRYRDIVSFWVFGMCNNFAFVVMLSAAHDILHLKQSGRGTDSDTSVDNNSGHGAPSSESNYLICSTVSTGAILLANILPTLFVKFTFPFFLQKIPYIVKITLVALTAAASFIIVGFAHSVWLSVLGVVCASFSSGLGEITFLSLTTFYGRNVISSWSSGTGGAGVFGALAYAGFTSLGLSPRSSLLVLNVVPAVMMIFYLFVLPPTTMTVKKDDDNVSLKKSTELTFKGKLELIPSLLKYMIPLSLVYYAQYFINQGLHELLYFNNLWLSRKDQYRWFQVFYQIGVFLSRSSVNLFQVKKLWILPLLQIGNMALLIYQVYFRFIPSLWLVMAIILWEGLLGGAAYVNTFYVMTSQLASNVKEFCFGVVGVGCAIGTTLAGFSAIPFHNHICDLKLRV